MEGICSRNNGRCIVHYGPVEVRFLAKFLPKDFEFALDGPAESDVGRANSGSALHSSPLVKIMNANDDVRVGQSEFEITEN